MKCACLIEPIIYTHYIVRKININVDIYYIHYMDIVKLLCEMLRISTNARYIIYIRR